MTKKEFIEKRKEGGEDEDLLILDWMKKVTSVALSTRKKMIKASEKGHEENRTETARNWRNAEIFLEAKKDLKELAVLLKSL